MILLRTSTTTQNPFLFILSHICADELIPRWYGLSGEQINIGILMYVAIDRNTELRCDIQDDLRQILNRALYSFMYEKNTQTI